MNYRYRADNAAIVDITKPPYNADPTGRKDCTGILIQALNDVLEPNIRGLKETKEKLLAMEDPNARISFEICKKANVLNVIFPEKLEPTKILYFPNGTYLVSDTITYSFEEFRNICRGVPFMEMNRQIHFKGESKEGVTIKLADHCPKFAYGSHKPVINFMQAEKSNIAMTNSFENITIDIGIGNPGAVGLVFFGNNTGTVKNVRIITSDPEKRGYAGLEIRHEIVSGCYVKDVEVYGFDYGIRALPTRNFMVFEDILLSNQRKVGFRIDHSIISIRHLRSIDSTVGVTVCGQLAHVVLVDSEIYGANPLSAAIDCEMGSCFIRNVRTKGYRNAVIYAKEPEVTSAYVEEYLSEQVYSIFPTPPFSVPLPVEDTPIIPWPQREEDWACVDDFGAVGDGITDDTKAIQDAMNCGKKYIFFQPKRYYINKSIRIPQHVERVNFFYCDFVAGEELKNEREKGAFIVSGNEGILLLEDVFTWEEFCGYIRFVEHAGKRTLIMSDLHTQTAAMYFNSVEGGKVFIEDCACTLGGDPYRDVPAYSFKGQTVFARHINPERSMCEIRNDNSLVWILGFKTESFGTAFETINGGQTEVLGGTISIGRNRELPAIVNRESTVSLVASTNGYSKKEIFPIAIEETQNGITKILRKEEFPIRLLDNYRIPLYVGRRNTGWL